MSAFIPSPEQEAILMHPAGKHARVLAGPGTGKSATVIEWIAKNPNIKAKLLTFTRAATAELVEKLVGRGDVALDKPSTVHSFCISVLLNNGGIGDFPRPFRMADEWETKYIIEHSLARHLNMKKGDVNELFKELAANWESLVPSENKDIGPAKRARFVGAWREHREIMGYALLSELPYALRSALMDHPDLQGVDYEMLVVDEYQDLNACDLEVIKLIAKRGSAIVAAGDDDQSIYSFRKAAPAGIRDFLQDYPGASDYKLTISRRCGKRIIGWANHVILGDASRPTTRGVVKSADDAPDGKVALLSFASHLAEAKGIAKIAKRLIDEKEVPASEILILLRSDHKGMFSKPIKEELAHLEIPYSDPNDVKKLLSEHKNRQAMSIMRLVVNREDSLAWASIFYLAPGIGDTFFDYVYKLAKETRTTFGKALLKASGDDFPALSTGLKRKAQTVMKTTLSTIDKIQPPDSTPEGGWGKFIADIFGAEINDGLRDLLGEIDERVEKDIALDRFLGQVSPIAKDISLTKGSSVRIMSLASSKGLTVTATIIAGLEQGLIPMDDCDLSEERRLLYVGMTRSQKYLFGTWARMRRGPTARAGRERTNQLLQQSTFLEGGPVQSQDGAQYIGLT
jgi:DNA helicase-2/ATP-dependent DNA helicase PcrA